jgi:hypothetical protein
VLIEYEISFGAQKVRITQKVEGNGESFNVKNLPGNQTILPSSYAEGQSAKSEKPHASSGKTGSGGPGDNGSSGGGPPFGGAPVTLIGPFISLCPCCEHAEVKHPKEHKPEEPTDANHL